MEEAVVVVVVKGRSELTTQDAISKNHLRRKRSMKRSSIQTPTSLRPINFDLKKRHVHKLFQLRQRKTEGEREGETEREFRKEKERKEGEKNSHRRGKRNKELIEK